MRTASSVAVVAFLMGAAVGVVQGQILRWDNGQPIPGTEFVDPAKYAAGDLAGYWFNGLDLSYADLHGAKLTGDYVRGAVIHFADLRDVQISFTNNIPSNWVNSDMRGARYTNEPNIIRWGQAGLSAFGEIQEGVANYLPIFNDERSAVTGRMIQQGTWYDPNVSLYGLNFLGLWHKSLNFVLDDQPWHQPLHTAAFSNRPINLDEQRLRLSFRAGTEPQVGSTYQIINWLWGVNGQFQSVEVPAGSAWDMTKLYSTGEVKLLSYTDQGGAFVPFLQADLDADGDVDTADLLTVLENWTGEGEFEPPVPIQAGNLDGDTDLDTADLLALLAGWTGAAGAGRAVAVPEPSGLVLMVVGILAIVRAKR